MTDPLSRGPDPVARELDGICHDLLHIIAGMAKALELYAPAVGQDLKADADSLFRRWTEVRASLRDPRIVEFDISADTSEPTSHCVKEPCALPASFAVKPNIPLEKQTLEQLRAERSYWNQQVIYTAGAPSLKAAYEFLAGCERWIAIREAEEAKYHG